jgi:hypothetical protein
VEVGGPDAAEAQLGEGQCNMAVALARRGRRPEALAALAAGAAAAAEESAVAAPSLEQRLSPWVCRFQAARAHRLLGDDAAAAALLAETAAGLRPIRGPWEPYPPARGHSMTTAPAMQITAPIQSRASGR